MTKGLLLSVLLGLSLLAIAADDQPTRSGFLTVPGGPIWYRITGAGSGIPLVVLHGGPGGTSCGFALLDSLGLDRPVLRYDQLGTGRSGRPDDMDLWKVDRFVEELHSIRQQLGLQRMHLLGHSWGGALAAQYVLDKGSKGIESLILSSPLLSTRDWIADANTLRGQLPEHVQQTLAEHEAAGTLDSDEYKQATQFFYERHVYGGKRPQTPDACAGAPGNAAIYEYMWGPTEFLSTGNLLDFDVTDRLGEFDLPVLFIAGEFDEAIPQRIRGFQQQVAGSRFAMIEDAAHASLQRQPVRYRKILGDFLRQVEAGKLD